MSVSVPIDPPHASREEHVHEVHGTKRVDEYAWLRLTEAQREASDKDPHAQRVIAHLRAENSYTEGVLAHVAKLRERLYKEIRGRIRETDMSVPYRENGYWYSHRYEEGQEYPVHQRRRDTEGSSEEVILDENLLARGHEHFDLSDYEISPGNGIVAYSSDTVGRRRYEIRFRDLSTGVDLPDVIRRTSGGCAWADDRTVFYARKDRTLRDHKIFRHIIGTDPGTDVQVFHERDTAFGCDVFRSRSNEYVIITTESTLTTEHWILPVKDPLGAFQVFLPRREGHEHSIFHTPGRWYVLTNLQARNFRLMSCAESDRHSPERWVEEVPHRPDVLLEDVDLFKDHMVLSERREANTHLRVRRKSDGKEHEITFNDPTYVAYTGTNPEWDSHLLRYGYMSLTTPSSVLEHDMIAGTERLLKQQEVVGGYDPERYVSERVWATAPDGVRVPISLVRRKDVAVDGRAPLLLYGYGSYGISVEPTFSIARLSLLDRGFIYAIAHVRGGEELGRSWYETGRMEHKQNTFTDFIACAEHLIERKYADPRRLFCMGGSAGGLLVGVVVNMRPDLWNAAVAEVPFVDVVTTMLDESIPLTTGEFDEWGDPKDAEVFARMLSYSPYDNVHDARYPAMLVLTGFHDSQVQYWEPAKWVGRLRDHQKGKAPILLHVDLDAGHAGASGRFERLKEVALIWAFLLDRAGLAHEAD
ncbi:MAG: S9 family peptidase [Flavobacteriales bacterium]|nr:S9 family peptidase [Flavobacteriales bacterium]MCB9167090.1 S9 family peptidase [Flavobacteriales bacterium]